MNMPPQYRLLEGSERQIAPRARLIGPADPNETLPVSIYVRPHADAPALPDHDHWMATPPAQRSFLSRADLAQQLSATQADLDQVAAFARAHGLAVEEGRRVYDNVRRIRFECAHYRTDIGLQEATG